MAVDYLIAVTPPDTGNLPAATDELPPNRRPVSDELVHWCHGDAGQLLPSFNALLNLGNILTPTLHPSPYLPLF